MTKLYSNEDIAKGLKEVLEYFIDSFDKTIELAHEAGIKIEREWYDKHIVLHEKVRQAIYKLTTDDLEDHSYSKYEEVK